MKRLSLFLLALLLAAPALAEPSARDPQAPVYKPRYVGTLVDFEHIQFLCTSDASGDYLSAYACATAESEVRKGARDFDVDVLPGGREKEDAFTLSVTITSSGHFPRAVNVRVEASRIYRDAVDQDAAHNDPAAAPRPGRLVFWDKEVLAVSNKPGDGLDEAVRGGIKFLLRQFFAWYGSQK